MIDPGAVRAAAKEHERPGEVRGAVLTVDLAHGLVRSDSLEEDFPGALLGGIYLADRLLLDRCPPDNDPLGPENVLVLAPGAMSGSGFPGTDRLALAAKSPLTRRVGESVMSTTFAGSVRRAGYCALILQDRAPAQAILVIAGDDVWLQPADELGGLDLPATFRSLGRLFPAGEFDSIAIGPAGENRVRYATIADAHGRVAGRTGLGAVMGSKNLKAIVVRSTAGHDGFHAVASTAFTNRLRRPEVAVYGWKGTVRHLDTLDRLGRLPGLNFGPNPAAGRYAGLGLDLLAAGPARSTCGECPLACEKRVRTAAADTLPVRLEYQTVAALGPVCGVGDIGAIAAAAQLCDRLGLDTISSGVTIAWAMESAGRGAFRRAFAGQVPGPGDSAGIRRVLRLIARREGVGDLLADGEEGAMQVKGLEIPGYDPRMDPSLALGLALAARGACHNRIGYNGSPRSSGPTVDDIAGVVAAVIEREDRQAVLDALGICKFLGRAFDDLYGEGSELLGEFRGWEVEPANLAAVGGRLAGMRRRFNVGAGLTPEEDSLPARLLPRTSAEGGRQFREMIEEYYRRRGWPAEPRRVGRSISPAHVLD